MEREIFLFVKEVCKILKIDVPKITEKMPEGLEHLKACAKSNGKEIFINPAEKISLDSFFAIAHELRHCWQALKCPEMLNEYSKPGSVQTEVYNLQPAEIDAHAFSALIMARAFGVSPTFENFPENVREAIERQKKAIKI